MFIFSKAFPLMKKGYRIRSRKWPDLYFITLEENKVYEFDNTRMHSVYNNSNQKRVHLIIDWKY